MNTYLSLYPINILYLMLTSGRYFTTILIIISAIFACPNIEARKTGFKLRVDKQTKEDQSEEQMSKGSFMVASQCSDCNNGYRIDQIAFTGYDKPQQSGVETFFIINNTDRTLRGVTLYIDYRTLDGRQLTKRFVRLTCDIPAGETRTAEIPSWDKQKSFYFEKSNPSKRAGNPYTVIFDPVAYYLKF